MNPAEGNKSKTWPCLHRTGEQRDAADCAPAVTLVGSAGGNRVIYELHC